jgi:putative acetyltransferase
VDPDVTVRPASLDDEPAIGRVLSQAFGGAEDEREDVRERPGAEPGAPVGTGAGTGASAKIISLVEALRRVDARAEIVAEGDTGTLVGHVLLCRGWIDARAELVEVLILSPLAVIPSHQGRGIGSRLLGAALAAADELGAPAVFLEGDPRYYSRQGFSAAEPLGFMRPSARIPAAAFQVALLESHEEWMSGAVVYPGPFWSHDCVGLRPRSSGVSKGRV